MWPRAFVQWFTCLLSLDSATKSNRLTWLQHSNSTSCPRWYTAALLCSPHCMLVLSLWQPLPHQICHCFALYFKHYVCDWHENAKVGLVISVFMELAKRPSDDSFAWQHSASVCWQMISGLRHRHNIHKYESIFVNIYNLTDTEMLKMSLKQLPC